MGINRLNIVLAGSYEDERNVTAEDFLLPKLSQFMGKPVSIVANAGKWASCYIDFTTLNLEQFLEEEEPYESFHQNLASIQQNLAHWLDQQPLNASETMSERGLSVVLFFDLDVDDNQIEMALTPSLLRACGRLNIKIDINSY